jgi:hypothetical protein
VTAQRTQAGGGLADSPRTRTLGRGYLRVTMGYVTISGQHSGAGGVHLKSVWMLAPSSVSRLALRDVNTMDHMLQIVPLSTESLTGT